MASDVLAAWQSVVNGAHLEPRTFGDAAHMVIAADRRRYVLKRIRGLDDLGEPRMRIAAEFRVLIHIFAAGLPVALPIVTDDGKLFAETDGALYTLLPYLTSTDETPSLAAFHEIGVTVARLHRALAAFPYEFPSWRIDLVPRTFTEALQDIATRLRQDAVVAIHRTLTSRRADMVEALSDLPEQRIHGDFHLGNILISNEKVTGLIDLDHLPIGPKIYDLAYLLANRAADETEQLPAITASVVGGYRSASTLNQHELAAVVPAMLAVQLQLVGWVLGNPRFAANARAHLNGYFWINEHYDELCAAVR